MVFRWTKQSGEICRTNRWQIQQMPPSDTCADENTRFVSSFGFCSGHTLALACFICYFGRLTSGVYHPSHLQPFPVINKMNSALEGITLIHYPPSVEMLITARKMLQCLSGFPGGYSCNSIIFRHTKRAEKFDFSPYCLLCCWFPGKLPQPATSQARSP